MNIRIINQEIKVPSRAHATDAGLDLYAPMSFVIQPDERRKMPLGFAIEVPKGHVGIVQGKSGLASEKGIDTIGNIIDEGYIGEISAILINHGNGPIIFGKHEKIAQLLVVPVNYVDIKIVDELKETDRGEGGFGSTGSR